jgi:hypothetical protein
VGRLVRRATAVGGARDRPGRCTLVTNAELVQSGCLRVENGRRSHLAPRSAYLVPDDCLEMDIRAPEETQAGTALGAEATLEMHEMKLRLAWRA